MLIFFIIASIAHAQMPPEDIGSIDADENPMSDMSNASTSFMGLLSNSSNQIIGDDNSDIIEFMSAPAPAFGTVDMNSDPGILMGNTSKDFFALLASKEDLVMSQKDPLLSIVDNDVIKISELIPDSLIEPEINPMDIMIEQSDGSSFMPVGNMSKNNNPLNDLFNQGTGGLSGEMANLDPNSIIDSIYPGILEDWLPKLSEEQDGIPGEDYLGALETDSTTMSTGDNNTLELILVNAQDSSDAITGVYITNTQNDNWQKNLLDSASLINPGSSGTIPTDSLSCDINYDIKVLFENGAERYEYNKLLSCNKSYTLTYSNNQ
jgi:hypothetical protein